MSGGADSSPAGGRLPDFLLIGAMKAGTTTLWGHLASHPSVFVCKPKEPQFFSRDVARARGLDWYRSLFSGARADQLCGEASTCYSRWPHFGDVAGRIARQLPDALLVYLLRHPVERSFSHYVHLMDERAIEGDGPLLSFERAIEEIPEIVDASLYVTQIERFLAHYPRRSLHVLTLEELGRDPAGTWDALQDFLGLARAPLGVGRSQAVDNRSGDRLARVNARRAIERVARNPLLAAAAGLAPRAWKERMRTSLEQSKLARLAQRRRLELHRERLTAPSPGSRARLLERFRRPTRDLEEFLGRRLTDWLA